MSHSETAGLGAKATEDDFKSQFIGKSANGINYTKNGASSDNEIDALAVQQLHQTLFAKR